MRDTFMRDTFMRYIVRYTSMRCTSIRCILCEMHIDRYEEGVEDGELPEL